jgi:SRSO17 transposase
MQTMSQTDELLTRLDRYLRAYRGAFRRQDQLRWAAAYLLGLLQAEERKSIENLARCLPVSAQQGMKDAAQALQHFIHRSPWDDDHVRRIYLERLAPTLDPEGVLCVQEMTFVKQGRHSVGVQRQFSSSLGRKVNCQLAVALLHVSESGAVPLGSRLYLPRGWLADQERLDAAGVPPMFQSPASKAAIALTLIDEARQTGTTGGGVALGASTSLADELREGLRQRNVSFLGPISSDLAEQVQIGNRQLQLELGLDHFEGRSWRGFHHHACLVLLANDFRATQSD